MRRADRETCRPASRRFEFFDGLALEFTAGGVAERPASYELIRTAVSVRNMMGPAVDEEDGGG